MACWYSIPWQRDTTAIFTSLFQCSIALEQWIIFRQLQCIFKSMHVLKFPRLIRYRSMFNLTKNKGKGNFNLLLLGLYMYLFATMNLLQKRSQLNYLIEEFVNSCSWFCVVFCLNLPWWCIVHNVLHISGGRGRCIRTLTRLPRRPRAWSRCLRRRTEVCDRNLPSMIGKSQNCRR